jgi:acetyl-CoA carboxylase biotin carboxyl carrier protein
MTTTSQRATEPFDTAELAKIAEWLDAAGLYTLEIEEPGRSIRMVMAGREPAYGTSEAGKVPQGGSVTVVARLVGVFLAAHPERQTPLVKPGDRVRPGDVLGILKTGILLTSVVAPVDGIVTGILAEQETMVDFGTPLFELRALERGSSVRCSIPTGSERPTSER